MASDIWLRTILIVRKETRCRHIGYSFLLTARVLLYAPSHRQDSTNHGLCYTSRGALAGTRNSSMGPPYEGSIRWPIAPWANALTTELQLAPGYKLEDESHKPERNVLFNDALNTFYLRLYGIRATKQTLISSLFVKGSCVRLSTSTINTGWSAIGGRSMSSVRISADFTSGDFSLALDNSASPVSALGLWFRRRRDLFFLLVSEENKQNSTINISK